MKKLLNEIKDKWNDFKASVARKWERLQVWAGENKGIASMMLLILFSTIMDLISTGSKKRMNNKAYQETYNTFYDDKTHMTYRLKPHSKARHNEINLEVMEGRKEGKEAGEVLRKMKVLR